MCIRDRTCSHHLNLRFWSGGFLFNSSYELSISRLPSRVPRLILPGYGHFHFLSGYGLIYFVFLLCNQHSPCFFPDVDRCVLISVHHISAFTSVYSLWQFQFLFYISTYAAFLAGRKKTVDLYQFAQRRNSIPRLDFIRYPTEIITSMRIILGQSA